MVQSPQSIDPTQAETVTWLARQIFTAYSKEYTGIKFSLLKCYCIYYQRISPEGQLDDKWGIYREACNGPCEICMAHEDTWQDRVLDEMVVYNSQSLNLRTKSCA
jgi:hypothetical protein